MNTPIYITSVFADVAVYASRVSKFTQHDWKVYIAWVGLMLGLLFFVCGFICFGWSNGVDYPIYVWNIPVGIAIFIMAISFDTIGHLTVYKQELAKAEGLVHSITIFAGVTSTIMLCLAYFYPEFLRIPTFVMLALSIFYSVIDEGLHWHRYLNLKSDRVEMVSHFFIFIGHLIMILSWWQWFALGYPGVRQTVELILDKLGA